MPSTSIDTFFACIIIITTALIATAFVGSTLQTSITNTKDLNKENYLNALSNNIVTNPGTPLNWGTNSVVPVDFGLADNSSAVPYEIDLDKITRLNTQSNFTLSYFDMVHSAKLNDIALGITVSQIMRIDIQQLSSSTIGGNVSFTFKILTSVDSKPVSSSLHCYVAANNYLNDIANDTSDIGLGYVTVQIPSVSSNSAILIVFARTAFDDRITSYALYNFADSMQEATPKNEVLTLSPLNYTLSLFSNSSGITIQGSYLFSFEYLQNLSYDQNSTQFQIPKIIDKSPFVIVVCGIDNGSNFQEWVSYPQVPLKAGSSFAGSEQNVFSYIITIKEALYRINISLGGLSP